MALGHRKSTHSDSRPTLQRQATLSAEFLDQAANVVLHRNETPTKQGKSVGTTFKSKRMATVLLCDPVILIIYVTFGTVVYLLNEQKLEPDSDDPLWWKHAPAANWTAASDQPPPLAPLVFLDWTVIDALYFTMATISTVGYGDLSPLVDDNGEATMLIFTVMYIVVGIVFIFPRLVSAVSLFTDPFFRWCRERFDHAFPPMMIDIDGDGDADYKVPPGAAFYYAKGLLVPGIFFVASQLLCAGIFTAVEPDMPYGTALYHCIVTATTVGYGDVTIATQGGRLFACAHILISVSLLAAIISDADGLRAQRKVDLQRGRQFLGRLNVDMILSLDDDGDGVDRFEFVIGMLLRLEMVTQHDVDGFVTQFDQLNSYGDGDGILTCAFAAACPCSLVRRPAPPSPSLSHARATPSSSPTQTKGVPHPPRLRE